MREDLGHENKGYFFIKSSSAALLTRCMHEGRHV